MGLIIRRVSDLEANIIKFYNLYVNMYNYKYKVNNLHRILN